MITSLSNVENVSRSAKNKWSVEHILHVYEDKNDDAVAFTFYITH